MTTPPLTHTVEGLMALVRSFGDITLLHAIGKAAEFERKKALEDVQSYAVWLVDATAVDAAAEALKVPSVEHPLDALLPDICQLIDAVRMEWQQQGSWSAWDQSVRDRIIDYNLAKLAASRRDPNLPIAKESFRCSACNGVGSIGRLGPCVACNGFGFVAAVTSGDKP